MRFSLWMAARQPWTELLAAARHAGATGWDGVWLADEPGTEPPPLECWTALAGLATAVPGITLGGLTSDDFHRHPAVVTKIATTVDHLSHGRVVLGLMPGSDPGGLARLEESCQVVKCLADSDEAVTMGGRFYRLKDAPLEPKPVQRPFPLLILGHGAAAVAARYGTAWATSGDPGAIPRLAAALHQSCEAIDRDPSEVALAVVTPLDAIDGSGRAEILDILANYADAGVDELIVADRVKDHSSDTLDWFISEGAAGLR